MSHPPSLLTEREVSHAGLRMENPTRCDGSSRKSMKTRESCRMERTATTRQCWAGISYVSHPELVPCSLSDLSSTYVTLNSITSWSSHLSQQDEETLVPAERLSNKVSSQLTAGVKLQCSSQYKCFLLFLRPVVKSGADPKTRRCKTLSQQSLASFSSFLSLHPTNQWTFYGCGGEIYWSFSVFFIILHIKKLMWDLNQFLLCCVNNSMHHNKLFWNNIYIFFVTNCHCYAFKWPLGEQ